MRIEDEQAKRMQVLAFDLLTVPTSGGSRQIDSCERLLLSRIALLCNTMITVRISCGVRICSSNVNITLGCVDKAADRTRW